MNFRVIDLYSAKKRLHSIRGNGETKDYLIQIDNLLRIIDDAIDARRPCRRIYVAGPLAIGDRAENINNAINAADELMKLGWHPYVPHLNCFWHDKHQHDYNTWLSLDMEFLRVSDAVLRLPGESRGADAEVLLATQLKIPVFFSLAHVREHSRDKGFWSERRQG